MRPQPNTKSTAATLVFIAIFGLWFWRPFAAAQQAFTFGYQPRPGTIAKLQLDANEIKLLEYSYTVDGRRDFGNTPSYYSRHTLSDIEEETGPLRQGRVINVYVKPSDHSKSVLVRGMTSRMQFGLAWCILASIGIIAGVIQILRPTRSQEEIRRSYDNMVDHQPHVKRLRLTPGGIKTPGGVATACFIVTFLLTFILLEMWRLLSGQLGGQNNFLSELTVLARLSIAIGIAVPAAVFDYFYTKRGNARGRWDLIVNEQSGDLQLPAVSAWGQPHNLRIEHVIGLEVKTIISPDESEGSRGTYRFNLICEHPIASKHDVDYRKRAEYTVAQSDNETKMIALADWVNDATGLGLSVEESSITGSFSERLAEIGSTSRSL